MSGDYGFAGEKLGRGKWLPFLGDCRLGGGRPVHTGVAIYTPGIDLNGDIEVKVKVDKRILRALKTSAGAATTWSRCGTRNISTIRLSRQKLAPYAATLAGARTPRRPHHTRQRRRAHWPFDYAQDRPR